MTSPLLEARDLARHFPAGSGSAKGAVVRAVDGISLSIMPGETLGIVGESGCGKSTLARLVLRLVEPTRGELLFMGQNLLALDAEAMRRARRHAQMVFQDPLASLNPRLSVGETIVDALRFHGLGEPREWKRKALELMALTGLSADYFDRKPHELSGGQNQRIGIARALVVEPRMLVLDEPVSALDVSVQVQILELLLAMRQRFQLTCMFISHNLSVVRRMSDRIAVLYLGRVMEIAAAEDLLERPLHPYTQSLIAAVLVADPGLRRVADLQGPGGELPSPIDRQQGCRFAKRCAHAMPVCSQREPELLEAAPGRRVACYLHQPTS